MLQSDYPLPEAVQSWVNRWLSTQKKGQKVTVTPLAGDGSSRRFYRLTQNEEKRVLLHDATWTSSQDYPALQAYLQRLKIPVPVFYEVDSKAGFLLMSDFGDELVQLRMQKDPSSRVRWLRESVRSLADLHGKAFPVQNGLPVSQRSFDTQKYYDEFQWTFTHLHQGLLKLPAPDAKVQDQVKAFCKEIAQVEPHVFCHRDYHTRNLLIHQEKIYLIDFQDARMGPPHYDLVSLLYDAYVPISDSERRELIAVYQEHLRKYPDLFREINWPTFEEELKPIAFQRVVKAAGSFASFFTRFGKKTHLPYLSPALKSAIALEKDSVVVRRALANALSLESILSLWEQAPQ